MMYRGGVADDEQIMAALRGTLTSEEIEYFPKKLFLFMIIPEFMVITAFLILFWQLLALFKLGHANLFRVVCVGRGRQLFFSTVAVLAALQLLMIGLYLGGQASAMGFSIECTVLNFLVATSVWVIMLVCAIMYSGSPYRSQAYKVKMKKLQIANIVWTVSRYFRGISGAFEQWILRFVL